MYFYITKPKKGKFINNRSSILVIPFCYKVKGHIEGFRFVDQILYLLVKGY